jgi:hypothetical protein
MRLSQLVRALPLLLLAGGLVGTAACSRADEIDAPDVAAEPGPATGLFEVYQRNRDEGRPSYVTPDLLLLSYSMIRNRTAGEVERMVLAPRLATLVEGLRAGLAELGEDDGPALRANRDFLSILRALLAGQPRVEGAADPERAQGELDRILAARAIAPSALWGGLIDYTQFAPRGRHAESEEQARFFRAMRYASTPLFAVQESAATGLDAATADRLVRQCAQLAGLISEDPELAATYRDLDLGLEWQYGPPDDLTLAEVERVLETAPEGETPAALRERLLDFAREHGRQPRILGAAVEVSKLEDGLTPSDVLTGWRLLPQRYGADAAALQTLVFDAVGEYQGDTAEGQPPVTLTLVEGRPVKGFPRAHELLALLGSGWAREQVRIGGDDRYDGYEEAFAQAAAELGRARGVDANHLLLMRAGLGESDASEAEQARRAELLIGFWTWQRYVSLLHAKQSYTPAGKALQPLENRPGAWLEPAPMLYLALSRAVEQQRTHAPDPAWDAFAGLLERCLEIAFRELQTGDIGAADEEFVNGLDRSLRSLTGGPDHPIAVDVHTHPGSGEVLQEAIGHPRPVEHQRGTGPAARGAQWVHYEFRQPLSERLTDATWQALLESGDVPAASQAGQRDPG